MTPDDPPPETTGVSVWCEWCHCHHAEPRDRDHWRLLKCLMPWTETIGGYRVKLKPQREQPR